MAAPIPSLPRVVLWLDPASKQAQRVKALLELAHLPFEVRDLIAAPPSASELEEALSWLPGEEEPSRDTLPPRALVDLTGPLVIAPTMERAIVADPPELALALFIPEVPAGETPMSLLRASLRGKHAV